MEPVPEKKASKKKATKKATKKKATKKVAIKAPPVIEVSDEELAAMGTAAARLGAQLQGTGTDEKALRAKEGRVYYIQCKACGSPGAWIFQKPAGELKPSEWESSYKPRNAGWPGSAVPCQVCNARLPIGSNRANSAPFFMKNYVRRFVRSIPAEQYEALKRGENINADVREVVS